MSDLFKKIDDVLGVTSTPDWALKRILEAKKRGSRSLNLSVDEKINDEYKLSQIPNEVYELLSLELLHLGNNRLSSISDSITKLSRLKVLDLRKNQFRGISRPIFQIKTLKTLDFNGNQLSRIPNEIVYMENLIELGLGNNRLDSNLDILTRVRSLEVLDLGGNGFSRVPDTIGDLENLVGLGLANNFLVGLPRSIGNLHNLEVLNLSNNKFTDIPKVIASLYRLRSLDLSRNQLRDVLEEIVLLDKLESIYLEGNPIETPPPEVINMSRDGSADIKRLRTYFREIRKGGEELLHEAKLIIVGEPGAGKTTLAKKIVNSKYELDVNESSTKGINILNWQFKLPNSRIEVLFRAHIWDFGGQEIYHATHQFFLTHNSLYAIVADTRKEDTDFYYWLSIVELLSGKSPVLIVKNEIQDRHRDINERQLRGQFNNLTETLATNLATNRHLEEVVFRIKHHLSSLPHIGSVLPKTWIRVRNLLETMPREFISEQEYFELCDRNGITQHEDMLQLVGFLHDLGVCLHFRDDPLLKRIVILSPEWGTDAVYKVLDNKRIIDNSGQFSRNDLEDIWVEKRYSGMHEELLRLMIRFQLCYSIPNTTNEFIAPQLLNENQPDYAWDKTNNLLLRYRYEFMPKGILSRFIVAMHRLIKDQSQVWKSGIILTKDETDAEIIELYGKREIRIRIAGKHKRDLFTIVAYELDNIHSSFERLKFDKLVPCNCAVCKNKEEPHFYKFISLQKRVEVRRYQIECDVSFEMVNILTLLDDIGGVERERAGDIMEIALRAPNITDLIATHYNTDELKTLCSQLDVSYDILGGEGLSGKARELKTYLERRGQLMELVKALIDDRPNIFRHQ